MSMDAEGDPIRLDFWVHHVGTDEPLLHQKALLPLRPQSAPDNATEVAAPADPESPAVTPSR